MEELPDRVTFDSFLSLLDEQSEFKHTEAEYRDSLKFFMRGGDGQSEANIEDVCAAMRKHTQMAEQEIEGFRNAHDNQLIIQTKADC